MDPEAGTATNATMAGIDNRMGVGEPVGTVGGINRQQ